MVNLKAGSSVAVLSLVAFGAACRFADNSDYGTTDLKDESLQISTIPPIQVTDTESVVKGLEVRFKNYGKSEVLALANSAVALQKSSSSPCRDDSDLSEGRRAPEIWDIAVNSNASNVKISLGVTKYYPEYRGGALSDDSNWKLSVNATMIIDRKNGKVTSFRMTESHPVATNNSEFNSNPTLANEVNKLIGQIDNLQGFSHRLASGKWQIWI